MSGSIRRLASIRRLVIPALLAVGSVACTDGLPSEGGDGESDRESSPVAATVVVPEERSTPFCSAMTDLSDRLENDPPDDVSAAIVEVYRDLVDDVPDAIRDDFAAVLADLDGQAVATATTTSVPTGSAPVASVPSSSEPDDPLSDEGFSPDDTPAGRVNAYVDFVCRGVVNNPGPPDTQPLLD